MKTKMFGLAIVVALTAGSAHAQQAPNPLDPNKIYRGLDQLAGMAADKLFALADANSDGALSPRELSDASERNALPYSPDPRAWAAFDINRDGVLSRAEVIETFRRVQVATRNGTRPF